MQSLFGFNLATIIANIPALLIGFAFHEFAHAWVADRLGDPTPRSQGRLSLNPFVHLDIFGTLMALLYQFGWAKPVLINPRYFRGNQRRGRVYVALAGPVSNLIMAFIGMFVWFLAMHWLHGTEWSSVLETVFNSIVAMNLGLGIFNLLPVPPLDGYAVLAGLLPASFERRLYPLEQYGMIILVILLFTNILNAVFYPAINAIALVYQLIISGILTPILGPLWLS